MVSIIPTFQQLVLGMVDMALCIFWTLISWIAIYPLDNNITCPLKTVLGPIQLEKLQLSPAAWVTKLMCSMLLPAILSPVPLQSLHCVWICWTIPSAIWLILILVPLPWQVLQLTTEPCKQQNVPGYDCCLSTQPPSNWSKYQLLYAKESCLCVV